MWIGHYSDVIPVDIKMDGAKNVKIRWLIDKSNEKDGFSMRYFEIEKNGYTPFHSHPWEHEIFVINGKGKLKYEDKEFELSPGISAFIPPNKKHQFLNTGDTTFNMICVIPSYGK